MAQHEPKIGSHGANIASNGANIPSYGAKIASYAYGAQKCPISALPESITLGAYGFRREATVNIPVKSLWKPCRILVKISARFLA